MTTIEARRETISLGRVASQTFGTIGRNGVTLLMLAGLLVVIPQFVSDYLQTQANPATSGSGSASGAMLAYVMAALIGAILAIAFQAAVIHGVLEDLNGRRARFADSLSVGLKLTPAAFAIGIAAGTAIGLGFILLIVPGIMLAMRWLIAIPARVAEGPGVFAALSRSTQLTKGSRWALFGIVFVFWVVAGIILAVVLGAAVALSINAANPEAAATGAPYLLLSATGIAAIQTLASAGIATIYHELRSIREGGEPATLAAVFA